MCDACEEDDVAIPYVPVDRDRVQRARQIEAAMPGERAPEAAWNVYFGLAGGAIVWRHFERIRQAYAAAEAAAAPAPGGFGKKRARSQRVPVCAEVVS
jgi:hypothetical protein